MLFPTVTFAVFFVAVFLAHLGLKDRPLAWKTMMLAASYVFYGWWNWRFCGLLALSTVANWAFGAVMADLPQRARRVVMVLAAAANLAMLGLFKYYGFFVEALSSSIGTGGLPLLDFVLPIGISFFTFQALSYVVDVYRRNLDGRPLLDFAVYLAFFPQLVAGPIVRATEFLPQLDRLTVRDSPTSPLTRPPIEVSEAAWLIGRGLFKKVVIASYLADTIVDPVFAAPSLASKTDLLLAFYGYAVQIYADFSGYTDMAIGIALLLGFRFPTNFDNPYRALSIQDFWRRWHMTLSRWLQDYLYIPLGGNRISPLVTYRNLMATMILGGLWHGAAWNFVAWGGVHGAALAGERYIGQRRRSWDWLDDEPAAGPSTPDGVTSSKVDDGLATVDATTAEATATQTGTVTAKNPQTGPETEAAAKTATGTAAGGREALWRRVVRTIDRFDRSNSWVGPVVRWFITFHIVGLAWVLFRADSFGLAWDFFTALATAPLGGTDNPMVALVVAAGIAAQLLPSRIGLRLQLIYARMDPTLQSIGFGGWIFLASRLGPEGVAPFIYFQF